MIRPRPSRVPNSDDVKRLRKKIAELKGTVDALEKRKEEAKLPPGQLTYRMGMGREFYSCKEWRELRWQILKENAKKHSDGRARCVLCGNPASDKPLEVDHVKPRSLFPHLELVKHNLQVLCNPCNQGKGASL